MNAVRAMLRTDTMEPIIEQTREYLRSTGDDVTARDLGYYEPEEASPLVAWLASDLASEITGHFFGIDGPRLTHWALGQPNEAFYHYGNSFPTTAAMGVFGAAESAADHKYRVLVAAQAGNGLDRTLSIPSFLGSAVRAPG
ncbi:hypothetical protein BSZ22_12430 [Bradyrhizobium canariense]|uniref:Uncharacterized protein n=1 Tax=Bradyrhizobium canariense TaxID=255045 RepID=A0A1X3GK85_9BRAD|nr:hypothetical protein BSZ22_12430 [Bradyrhizobium canariense]OSI79535.1 hypothetical protein BSZ23_14120 [Bradyrhizobium canariense]OSI91220.1 hypothetical protein BSZ24_17930 [Bradyrhizobium canariense]OSI91844.1 hypothetical protein BSZ25_13775 [Bradyrhizobium canariense]OSJ05653.1 hypothetical protein BSZ16_11555 [Bradyrhizobium canariense]